MTTVFFYLWGQAVTVLEFCSVILALVGVGLGIRGTRWTWPFYFFASLLYGLVFLGAQLYASAATQVVFMAAAVWGWFGWGEKGVRVPARLSGSRRWVGIGMVVVAWLALAPLLQWIGGVATWGDAFVFVGSLAAQVLMVREYLEAWPMWVAVNVVGVLLYGSQGLYFTAVFYAVLIGMAIVGWRSWGNRGASPAEVTAVGVDVVA
jgi:nicotinamide mononucleotide transporter